MKKYIKSSRYDSDPATSSVFDGFDRQKYYRMYIDIFRTITDGSNADLANNIKAAFKLVGGKCRIDYMSDRYIKFDGHIGSDYTVGGSISLEYLQGDARRLAEDLTMGYFRTTEGGDIVTNTYAFVDWMLG